MTPVAALVIAALLAAGVAVFFERRHRRLRTLLKRAERREAELLVGLRGAAAQALGARLALEGKRARGPLVFRADHGEDLFLVDLFHPPGEALGADRFYIECGAFDGVRKSVTSVLDALGWNGLLVEALPDLAAACRASRPSARVECAAVSRRGSSGEATFARVGAQEGQSFLPGAGSAAGGRAWTEVRTRLTTLAALLEGHARPIDALVLDIEGAELDALDGLDLDRFRPRVILVEDHGLGEEPELLRTLEAHGYEHATWVWRNRVMVRRDEPGLLERARDLAMATAAARTPG